jgi:methionyl-tRNA formyltransferase
LVRYCATHDHELVLVVTQADQAQGRGQRLMASPVKQLAEMHRLNIMQPTTLRKGFADGDEFFAALTELDLDLAIVVAYGKIITERLLKTPRRGFVNVHGSLLPRFRGAAPIQRAIAAGDAITGVCLMDMVKGLDEGDVFASAKTPIIPSDTSATLFRRLSHLGCALLFHNLDAILRGTLSKTPQSSEGIVYAHMLDKLEGLLDFKKSGAALCHEARAFDPWPNTFGFIRGKRVKFFDSFFVRAPTAHIQIAPGTVVCAKDFLGVKTIDGVLYFQRLQIEGKTILPIRDALRGFLIEPGDTIDRR